MPDQPEQPDRDERDDTHVEDSGWSPILLTMPDGSAVTERDLDLGIVAAQAMRSDGNTVAPVPAYCRDAAAAVLTARIHGGMSIRDVPEVVAQMFAAALSGTGLTLMHRSYLNKQARVARSMVRSAENVLEQLRGHLDILSGQDADPLPTPPRADPRVWPEPTLVQRPRDGRTP